MKFFVENKNAYNLKTFMRKIGYVPFHNSFTRRLGSGFYPRFHIYAEELDDKILIKLHLDQKKASYRNAVAHSADYEDTQSLEEEKNRILSLL